MTIRKSPRRKLSPRKYRQLCEYVYNRDGFCLFCGTPDNATPAHVKRRSQGGHDAPNNLVRACVSCHMAFDSYQIELPGHVKVMLAGEPDSLVEK